MLRERVEATAFLWHNYGKSTIGSKEDLERVPVERPAAFYHKYYRPDNAVLVITGRLDESKTLQFVADTFGKIARPKAPVEQTYTVEPAQDGERYVELRRVGQGQEVVLAYHGPAAGHPDSAALQVLSGILSGGGGGRGGRGGRGGGGGGEGRLAKALVDTKIAESASMNASQLHDPGLIFLTANLNKDQSLDAARKALVDVLADVLKNPPTKEEVDRIRTGLLRNLERSLSDPQSIATGALNAAISQGDWRLMFLQHDRLEDVSPSDVLRVAQAYFKASNRTVGYYIPDVAPDRTVIPATPDLESLLANYKSKVTVSQGERFDPTPANIESRVVRSKLANGMKVVVLPKETANNMVLATIELRFGDATSLKGQNAAAQFAGSLIQRGGTKTHTRQQLQDEMRKLDANITVSGGGGAGGGGGRGGRGGGFGGGGGVSSANANISVPAKNFAPAMRLAAEMLKEPAYPETEFELARTQRLKNLENVPTEPTQLATELLQRHLTPWTKGDVLYSPTREEQIVELQKVTLDDVKKFHDRFYGANFGAFAEVRSSKAGGRAARQLEHVYDLQANRYEVQAGGADQHQNRNTGQSQRAVRSRSALQDVAGRSRLCGHAAGGIHVRRADHFARFRSHPQSRGFELWRERPRGDSFGRRFGHAFCHRQPESSERSEGRIQLHGRAEADAERRLRRQGSC